MPSEEHRDGLFNQLEQLGSELKSLKRREKNLIRAVKELKAQLKTYLHQARLLDLTQDAIMVRDMSDLVTFWNRGAEKRYGWSKEEALGRTSHTLLETEFPQSLPEVQRTLITEGFWEGELVHTTRPGQKIVVASRWTLQRDKKGLPAAVLEISNDITKRKAAEQALIASEERFHKLFEVIPDAVLVSNRDVIMLANMTAARLLGMAGPDELMGRPLLDLFTPEYRDRVRLRTDLAVQEGEPLPLEKRKVMRPDGKMLDVETAVTAITVGEEQWVIRVIRDITRRLQDEEAILRKDREIERRAQKVEKLNAALSVLLENRDVEARQKEENIRATLDKLIQPYLVNLKETPLDPDQQTYVELIEANLNKIGSSFARKLDSWKERLTPAEIQVADLIRAGKRTKEIAALLKVTANAVSFHRANIRAKMGLTNKPTNLVSYLRLMA
ncbi:MAG: PAS domain S-box protein [Thermodesulfobacteriota bacterium]